MNSRRRVKVKATTSSWEKELHVLVASSLTERALGLSGRDSIEEDGMLFVRPIQEEGAFRMDDVRFPITMAFFDRDGGLVDQVAMHPGSAVYRPAHSFKYVLELTDLEPLPDDAVLELD